MPSDVENPVEEIKDNRKSIDDLLSVIYRCHDSDCDTESEEVELQARFEADEDYPTVVHRSDSGRPAVTSFRARSTTTYALCLIFPTLSVTTVKQEANSLHDEGST